MTEIRLHRASRMLLIGKRMTARMPEHVRVDPKVESSRFTETEYRVRRHWLRLIDRPPSESAFVEDAAIVGGQRDDAGNETPRAADQL